jgi:hypothetical protein
MSSIPSPVSRRIATGTAWLLIPNRPPKGIAP